MRTALCVACLCAVAFAPLIALAAGPKRRPLKLILPKPQFVGTPKNVKTANLGKPRVIGKRPALLVPPGVTNVARGKTVTSSDGEPILGELSQITDGDKEAEEGAFVEVSPGKQWVQVDLGKRCAVYAIAVWHYHSQARVYRDVVIQISDDAIFLRGVKTLYSNDHDNSLGLGVGKQKEYFETYEGLLVDAKGARGRYVRCYSRGSTAGDMNHWTEVEVHGRVEPEPRKRAPAKEAAKRPSAATTRPGK